MYGACVDIDIPSIIAQSNATVWGGSGEALGDVCNRGFVIIGSDAYALLKSGAGGASAQFTSEEISALKYQAANPSPFNLSIVDGSYVAGAVAATWALAWVLRTLVKTLDDSETQS